jgi:CRP-like cAMP-binding protein
MLVQFSEVPMASVLPRNVLKLKKKTAFDAQLFLQSVGASRRVEEFRKKQAIFSQGEAADSVMYIQKGASSSP